jgi:ABC-type lipoprotein export system ATPase subunit
MTNRHVILQMQDVTKIYNDGAVPFVALDKVGLEIEAGEFLGITGRSGAGKTTLLNMLSGVDTLTSGSVVFHAPGEAVESSRVSVQTLSEDALARWRGENLGIIYQSFELMPTLSLLENVMLPPDFSGAYRRSTSTEHALELLEMVEIAEHAHKIPAHISGGQKQRVAIARALVNDPQIIIADEPTGNLDSVTADTILGIFKKLVGQGKTVVMVTHDQSFASRFTRCLQIEDGIVSEPVTQVSAAPARTTTRHFVPVSVAGLPAAGGNGGETRAAHRPDERAIVLRDVEKVYETAAGKFPALKAIDLELNYGQFVSVVGKSGCGKSTLLNMITGIDHPTRGDVIVGGESIYRMSESKRALWRGQNLGVVFQFFQLLPTLSLLENTMLPMDYCNQFPFNERPDRALELLKTVGLEEQAHKLPSAVSSGQQQEAAIARALATDPAIIVADEPTGNLDSRSAQNVLNLFERLARGGKTILIVTHDPSITKRTDQTIILSDGEIIDEAVARALPFLSHPSLLAATKRANHQRVAPGALILEQGSIVDHLFLVASGEVDVFARKNGSEVPLARLGRGQFFGEVELTRGGGAVAAVRGAGDGAELAVLPKGLFEELMEASPDARDAVRGIADQRLSENRSKRGAGA